MTGTTLPMIYSDAVVTEITERINIIDQEMYPLWGKMNASQMLAHLNVMFEMGLSDQYKRPKVIIRFILQVLVKEKLINEVPYQKNSKTAPAMVIKHQPDFAAEKERLLAYLIQVKINGAEFFSDRRHPVFGQLTANEWSNLFYKHIDHHLNQFAA